jgi:pimeloyl-ACP methyl ester carboxylesterase
MSELANLVGGAVVAGACLAPKPGTHHTFHPKIEPYERGMLEVGDGHRIYWELCGNPKRKPAVVLHGGPGSGCNLDQRRQFDPKTYRTLLFDQSRPQARLEANTTSHLIADMERLRKVLAIDRWLLHGGSLGRAAHLRSPMRKPFQTAFPSWSSAAYLRYARASWRGSTKAEKTAPALSFPTNGRDFSLPFLPRRERISSLPIIAARRTRTRRYVSRRPVPGVSGRRKSSPCCPTGSSAAITRRMTSPFTSPVSRTTTSSSMEASSP